MTRAQQSWPLAQVMQVYTKTDSPIRVVGAKERQEVNAYVDLPVGDQPLPRENVQACTDLEIANSC